MPKENYYKQMNTTGGNLHCKPGGVWEVREGSVKEVAVKPVTER